MKSELVLEAKQVEEVRAATEANEEIYYKLKDAGLIARIDEDIGVEFINLATVMLKKSTVTDLSSRSNTLIGSSSASGTSESAEFLNENNSICTIDRVREDFMKESARSGRLHKTILISNLINFTTGETSSEGTTSFVNRT